MKVEIEIEEGLIPKGFEVFCYRVPLPGDIWLSLNGDSVEYENTVSPTKPRLILRRNFDLEALKEKLRTVFAAGTWFAMDKDGCWYAYTSHPNMAGESWKSSDELGCQELHFLIVDWPDAPWDESKFEI